VARYERGAAVGSGLGGGRGQGGCQGFSRAWKGAAGHKSKACARSRPFTIVQRSFEKLLDAFGASGAHADARESGGTSREGSRQRRTPECNATGMHVQQTSRDRLRQPTNRPPHSITWAGTSPQLRSWLHTCICACVREILGSCWLMRWIRQRCCRGSFRPCNSAQSSAGKSGRPPPPDPPPPTPHPLWLLLQPLAVVHRLCQVDGGGIIGVWWVCGCVGVWGVGLDGGVWGWFALIWGLGWFGIGDVGFRHALHCLVHVLQCVEREGRRAEPHWGRPSPDEFISAGPPTPLPRTPHHSPTNAVCAICCISCCALPGGSAAGGRLVAAARLAR